jgi:hypothetical protein
MKMRNMKKAWVVRCAISVILLASSIASAQKLPKPIYVQAQAMGEQQQMGQTFGVTLIIEEFSPPTDQQGLLEAFTAKGNEGLTNALDKMHSKGRMSITGTLGYEVTYVRQWKEPDGSTKYRLVTDRPIRFGEAWSDSRSMDYSISGVEIVISPDKKKSTGTLFPLVQLKLNKENHIELETYQNPWKLVDVRLR